MGWAEELPTGRFRACWRDDQNRRRSRSGFTNKARAMRYAGEQEGKSRRGDADLSGRSPTWGMWRDQWLAARRVEPSTARQDAVRIHRHIGPRWELVRLNKITRRDVQAWVNDLAETAAHRRDGDPRPPRLLSPATVDRIYRLFSQSMKAAVLDGRIPVTPCIGITVPTSAPGHERYLDRGEFDLIAFHLPEPHRSMALLLVATGMRFGEAAGLHWQRVDLVHNEIHIVETWDAAARRIKPYPKGKRIRGVPIASWLRPVLDRLLDRQASRTDCGLPHAPGSAPCRSGLVIPAPEGGAFDGHNFGQREWATAVGLAGVGHCRLHDLRHTFASWLRQSGVDLEEVQRLLGHGAITTTARYSHLGASQRGNVLAALEQRTPTPGQIL